MNGNLLRHPNEQRIINVKRLAEKWRERCGGDQDEDEMCFARVYSRALEFRGP
jgi:hypothetical protein